MWWPDDAKKLDKRLHFERAAHLGPLVAFPQIRDNVVRGGVEPPTFRFSGQPVRREPGCVTFTAYEARDTPGRFYLYEVYTDAAAFATHLQTEHVHTFISTIPDLSTGGPGSLIDLTSRL